MVVVATALLVGGLPLGPGDPLRQPALAQVPGQTNIVSITSAGAQVNDSSGIGGLADMTPDGRFVAFTSNANTLAPGDANIGSDVFVHDRVTGRTIRASVSSSGAGSNSYSWSPSISGDGRYVAFTSLATNLVSGDTNTASDAFVRDLQTGTTTRASVTAAGAQRNNGGGGASISLDGRYVAFTGSSSFDGGPTNYKEVWVKDMQTGTVTRATPPFSGAQSNAGSDSPSFSEDGRFVTYDSLASNLVGGDTNGFSDVFVHDLQAETTTLVSVSPTGGVANGPSVRPNISADGERVVFQSGASNLIPDGADSNSVRDVFVRDIVTGTTIRASVSSAGAQITHSADLPVISGDGRYVAFNTQAPGLVANDTDGWNDVFVHDTQTGVTSLTTVNSAGQHGNKGGGGDLAISRDGSFVAFPSFSTNLVPGDNGYNGDKNGNTDVFVRSQSELLPGVPLETTFGLCGDTLSESGCKFQGDPVNSVSGSFATSVSDLYLPGIGLPFTFTRTYNSADPTTGAIGTGWTHSYAIALSLLPNGDAVVRGDDGQQVVFDKQPGGGFTDRAGGRASLSAVAGGYELVRNDQLRYRFSDTGQLTSIADPNGNALSVAYQGANPEAITDTSGRVITLTHDGNGRLTDVALPDGRAVHYAYTDGLLTTVTDVRGGVTTYAYDSQRRLTSITDQNGNATITNVYGWSGRVIEQIDARGKHSFYAWDPATETASFTNARDKQWKHVYRYGQLMASIDPLGKRTEYAYDLDMNLASVTDPGGNETTMTYDAKGNVLTRSAPAALGYQPEVWTYTAQNRVDTYEDRLERITDFDYNAAGNLTKITRPGAVVTEIPRTPTGLADRVIDPRLKTTDYNYDASGNLTEVITPKGNKTTMGYDSSGRMTSMVEARGNEAGATAGDFTSTYGYDAANHPIRVTDPLGHESTSSYDAAGNLDFSKDAKLRTTDYQYNPASHLTKVVAPGGAETVYAYDDTGNLSSRTDAKMHTTSYTYDSTNRLDAATLPGGAKWTYGYDVNGNLNTVTDAAGNSTPGDPGDGITTYAYDEIDRVTSIDHSDSTPDVGFGYDANSNRTSMTDGHGTETFSYDDLDRVATITRGSTTLSYDYDASSQITKRTYPGGVVVDYTYDDDSLLDTVASGGAVTDYDYNAAGELETTTRPSSNGHVEARTYDRAGRLTQVENAKAETVLSRFTYTLDDVGNPTTVTDKDGAVTSYSYDLDRDFLTGVCYQASCPGASDPFIRYDYDPVGNRTDEVRPDGATGYTYDAADRLTSSTAPSGTTSYSHDANGNMTQAGGQSFSYDLANRMASTTSGSTTTDYAYDGDGKRLKSSTGAGAAENTNYLWDPSFPLPELIRESDGADSVLRSYVHANDLISMTTSGDPSYYHHDGLGSISNVTDASGTPQWAYSYEPFGTMKSSVKVDPGAPDNQIRFTGEYLDPTELYHLRARQYNPALGRFTATDPLKPPIMAPSVSPHIYANDQPTVFTDPSGLVPAHSGFGQLSHDITGLGAGDYVNSCASVRWEGNLGYIAVQTSPGGFVQWGAYMHNVLNNFGIWIANVFVNGSQVDHKLQPYPPHGSLPPSMAPAGSILSIQVRSASPWFSASSVPNACVVPG